MLGELADATDIRDFERALGAGFVGGPIWRRRTALLGAGRATADDRSAGTGQRRRAARKVALGDARAGRFEFDRGVARAVHGGAAGDRIAVVEASKRRAATVTVRVLSKLLAVWA